MIFRYRVGQLFPAERSECATAQRDSGPRLWLMATRGAYWSRPSDSSGGTVPRNAMANWRFRWYDGSRRRRDVAVTRGVRLLRARLAVSAPHAGYGLEPTVRTPPGLRRMPTTRTVPISHSGSFTPEASAAIDVVEHINRHVIGTELSCRTAAVQKLGSTIVSVEFAKPDHNYFIKFKRPQPQYGSTVESTRASLTREYVMLKWLASTQPVSFAIPRPLYFDSENLVLATSAVPGTPFLSRYRLGPRLGVSQRDSLIRDLRAIGGALGDFHRLSAPPELEKASLHRQAEARAGFMSRLDHDAIRSRPGLRSALLSRVDELTHAMDEGGEHALVHDDLGLHNVLCGARPGFIDLDSVKLGPPEGDLAQLILSLVDLTAPGPIPALRRRLLTRAIGALLEGYKAPAHQLKLKPYLLRTGLAWIIDLEIRRSHQVSRLRRLQDSLLLARQQEFLIEVLTNSPHLAFAE